MNAPRCPRVFEAEAMRDGRLTGAELAAFERHKAQCADCAHEARALDELARQVLELPDDALDELHVRRERMRLLAAFDRSLLLPGRRPGARWWLVFPGVVAALATAAFLYWRVRPTPQFEHTPNVVVHPESSAAWSKRIEGHREIVTLQQGALWIHVDHAKNAPRLLVVLPDGELEDTGTTFTVSAERGHTQRVAVKDGTIVLRLQGQPSVALGPGETWVPNGAQAVAVSANPSASTEHPSSKQLPIEVPSVIPMPKRADAAPVTAADPSGEFRLAMSAFRAGDNVRAAAAFATFLANHPREARAQDAAYLRVIAFQRAGDENGMKQAAREYLRLFPAGFRRTEVERLSVP